ncbi:hypothetical protein [Streptomyces sp. NRRL S-920]|uniref:hypothetical protein n=1 Tax=Streptomyces sp. NRRL S-920 TaxID=1463921 RepID=UPI0004CBC70A|nr:hypothetical protein [Streptomyces sp. NRRL S-920]
MSTTARDIPQRAEQLVGLLRVAVRQTLVERADTIRRSLPPRPADAQDRHAWLCSLDDDQARRAALLDRLDALCGHLADRPALGYAPGDPLPAAALEEADGFTSETTAALIAEYRAQCGVSTR